VCQASSLLSAYPNVLVFLLRFLATYRHLDGVGKSSVVDKVVELL
jgi:hypothetical protein